MRTVLLLVGVALVICPFRNAVAQGPVLDRLATYAPPPYPADKFTNAEPYDYRKRDGDPVPSKPMAFVEDVCTLLLEEDSSFKPQLATLADVTRAVTIYATRPWTKIPALRPWTHSNFVRSLSSADRRRLAEEATAVLRSGRITLADCT